ncbi:MAG: Rieske 2Fe-2S domain-containing protein, partial [Hyphomicrobiales bacterium]|nr:Rieske 2Fe-2S domain-containing protein [Hyphomicrobiales bacterium]
LELERQRIFASDWVCPGLAADIPDPGDYLTYSVADQPVFCVRGKDGEIRTLSNVCRHRMMLLLEDRGRTKRVVCPYHAWTYDLDGALIGAGHMDKSDGFDKKDHCLPEIRTEIWNGWIYITLNPDAAPVADILKPLDDMVEGYQMANYVPVILTDHVWNTNWKLLTENFMEGYHLPVAHKATVGLWMPMSSVNFPDKAHDGFTYQTFIKDENAIYGRAPSGNARLEGHWRHTTVMPTVFPSHMYILAPDHVWYLSLRPKGTDQVHVRFGVAIAPEVHASLDNPIDWVADLAAFFDKVNAEDRFVVEGICEGSRAPDAQSGPLSWLEHEIHDFMRYLSSRLTPESAKQKQAAE